MILHAIVIGITAWVFAIMLTEPEMIFGWWWRAIHYLPEWLRKPLGACEYCLAGQLALWYYIYYAWGSYNLFYHIGFISVTILTVKIITIIVYGNRENI